MRFKDTIGISALLNDVTHLLNRQLEDHLRAKKLTMAQYTTLSHLEQAKALTNAEMARLCSVRPQTMNRIVSNLLKTKMITADKASSHGLQRAYKLTDKAVACLCDCHIIINDTEEKAIASLSEGDYKKLEKTLQQIKADVQPAT